MRWNIVRHSFLSRGAREMKVYESALEVEEIAGFLSRWARGMKVEGL